MKSRAGYILIEETFTINLFAPPGRDPNPCAPSTLFPSCQPDAIKNHPVEPDKTNYYQLSQNKMSKHVSDQRYLAFAITVW